VPLDISGKIGNFSHLFSNVFRIVKDDQEVPTPFQLANISSETTSDTQNELLNVSLLSDNKINLDNQNISMIVSAFLAKLNPGEFGEVLPDTDKLKVDTNIPKYFSLSKNEFIKEIKSIIDTLKNGDPKSLENVEISLIANGQSIKINPLTTNVVDLENWVTEQFQSNPDFEILVKSEQKKLAIDVEQIKNETIKPDKPVEIVSVITDENIESETKPILVKNVVEPVSGLKIASTEGSTFQQPIIGLKQPYVNVNGEILKPENPNLQNLINPVHKNDSQTSVSKNIVSKESITVELNNPGKSAAELHSEIMGKIKPELAESIKNNLTNTKKVETQNISAGTSDLKNKIVSETHGTVVPKQETSVNKENNFSDSGSLNLKKVSSEKSFETSFKNLNIGATLKNNVLHSNEQLKNAEAVKQSSEVNVKNESHSDTKISVKANHKINLVSLNKNDIKEKVVLNELIEKTNVKNIEVNVQKNTKAINVSAPKFQDQYQHDLTSLKENTTKVQSPFLNAEVKKVLLTNQESKQPALNKIYESENIKVENVKPENSVSNALEQKPIVMKTDLNTKVIDTVKLQSESKLKVQQEHLIVEQSKTVLNESSKAKFEAVNNPLSKRIVPPDAKSELQTVDLKSNSNQKEKAIVENLRTGLKEFVNDESKQNSIIQNQVNSKTVKIDYMQRRVYSQIPPLEVIANEAEVKNVKNSVLNVETNDGKNIQSMDETLKSTSNNIEQKPKNEKQVWVKVSLEKNENEVVGEQRKSTLSQNKITLDASRDGMKKDSDQNNYSEKELYEYAKPKPQTLSVESSPNTEVKSVNQNQNTSIQQDLTAGLKSEIKLENNPFKSALQNEETKFTSRAAEMVEKVKIISSGEMIREIYKVIENGDKQSIVLRLVPKELGAVKIMLDTIDNVLTAKVEVENETVGQIIRNNVDQLKHSLLQSGVHVNSINISYQNSDQKQHGFNNHKRKNPAYQQENEIEELDETIVTKKFGYSTYEFLA
jgi:hypothetical protein